MAIKGYNPIKKATNKRLLISVEGRQKRGKTTFALSAPAPIAWIDFNADTEGVADKYVGVKNIQLASFPFGGTIDQVQAKRLWEGAESAYYAALRAPLKEVRTVVVDDGSSAWELIRYAEHGRVQGEMQLSYTHVNAVMRRMLADAKLCDKNVIWTHRLTDEYENYINPNTGKKSAQRTGGEKFAGYKGVPYEVQVIIRCWRREIEQVRKGKGAPLYSPEEFGFTVMDCRGDSALNGMEFVEPMNSFAYLASSVFADTSPEEWE